MYFIWSQFYFKDKRCRIIFLIIATRIINLNDKNFLTYIMSNLKKTYNHVIHHLIVIFNNWKTQWVVFKKKTNKEWQNFLKISAHLLTCPREKIIREDRQIISRDNRVTTFFDQHLSSSSFQTHPLPTLDSFVSTCQTIFIRRPLLSDILQKDKWSSTKWNAVFCIWLITC